MIDTGETARSEVAAGPSGLWVLNQHADPPDELVRVDPGSGRVLARIGVGHNAARPVVGPDGLVWLTRAGPRSDRPELLMVNPATDRVGLTVSLPRGPTSRPTPPAGDCSGSTPGSEPPGQRSDRRSSANASARSPSW